MPSCGAKTRKGKPCPTPAMPNGRCRMHGGKSPGAKKPGGLYSRFYTEEEKAIVEAMELSHVDEELKLAKIQLYRAQKAQEEADELELVQKVVSPAILGGVPIDDGSVPDIEQKTYKKVDLYDRINTLTARIQSLTATRQQLLIQQADHKLKLAEIDKQAAVESDKGPSVIEVKVVDARVKKDNNA